MCHVNLWQQLDKTEKIPRSWGKENMTKLGEKNSKPNHEAGNWICMLFSKHTTVFKSTAHITLIRTFHSNKLMFPHLSCWQSIWETFGETFFHLKKKRWAWTVPVSSLYWPQSSACTSYRTSEIIAITRNNPRHNIKKQKKLFIALNPIQDMSMVTRGIAIKMVTLSLIWWWGNVSS